MTLALIAALALCPAPGDVVMTEQMPIEVGCVVPPPGPWRLVLEPAYVGMADDIGFAGQRISDLEANVGRLELSLGVERERCADEVKGLRLTLEETETRLTNTADLLAAAHLEIRDRPSRLTWAGVGAGAVVVALLVFVFAVD